MSAPAAGPRPTQHFHPTRGCFFLFSSLSCDSASCGTFLCVGGRSHLSDRGKCQSEQKGEGRRTGLGKNRRLYGGRIQQHVIRQVARIFIYIPPGKWINSPRLHRQRDRHCFFSLTGKTMDSTLITAILGPLPASPCPLQVDHRYECRYTTRRTIKLRNRHLSR